MDMLTEVTTPIVRNCRGFFWEKNSSFFFFAFRAPSLVLFSMSDRMLTRKNRTPLKRGLNCNNSNWSLLRHDYIIKSRAKFVSYRRNPCEVLFFASSSHCFVMSVFKFASVLIPHESFAFFMYIFIPISFLVVMRSVESSFRTQHFTLMRESAAVPNKLSEIN